MDENFAAYISRSPAAEGFCRWYMKWLYFPMFDHHIAVSGHTAAELSPASRGHKVQRGIWILPMGVDTERFIPGKRTARHRSALIGKIGADHNSTVLVYAGRLAPEKNVNLLIEVAARLRDENCHLVIAGDGIARRELENRCREAGIPVTFLGHVKDPEALAVLLANADIFLHPNPREPFGIAPLEAMAAGLPLAAPNTGGITSYASQENAWLTEPTADSFAHEIRVIRDMPDLRAYKTARARETALQYAWPKVTNAFLSLYQELFEASRDKQFTFATQAHLYSTPGDIFGREIQLDKG
jgi:alpha-1,6-mannosyltransferase